MLLVADRRGFQQLSVGTSRCLVAPSAEVGLPAFWDQVNLPDEHNSELTASSTGADDRWSTVELRVRHSPL